MNSFFTSLFPQSEPISPKVIERPLDPWEVAAKREWESVDGLSRRILKENNSTLLFYLAAFLDSPKRERIEAIAEKGFDFKKAAKVSGVTTGTLRLNFRSYLREALRRMRGCISESPMSIGINQILSPRIALLGEFEKSQRYVRWLKNQLATHGKKYALLKRKLKI